MILDYLGFMVFGNLPTLLATPPSYACVLVTASNTLFIPTIAIAMSDRVMAKNRKCQNSDDHFCRDPRNSAEQPDNPFLYLSSI